MSQDEVLTTAKAFAAQDFSSFSANGIRVGGEKFMFLRELDGAILGKKVRARRGPTVW